jgi:DNA-directed RNA polymerase subunit M/transcription elongation factor TFIIS
MNFCPDCKNMLYTALSPTDLNQLVRFCRQCSFSEDITTTDGLIVLNTQFKSEEQKFNHMIGEYTVSDPTLPRMHAKCPNDKCKTNEQDAAPAEIVYMRYDDPGMKYVYICKECKQTWKTDSKK